MNAESGFQAQLAGARTGEWALRALYRRLHPGLLRYLLAHEPGHAEQLDDLWLDVAAGLELFDGERRRFGYGCSPSRVRVSSSSTTVAGKGRSSSRATAAALRRICALEREEAGVILLRAHARLTSGPVANVVGRSASDVRALRDKKKSE